MEGVEDIPGAALSEGIQWGWETFPEYLDALSKLERSMDFATQIPHSALRGYVMGPASSETDDATPEQIAEMRRLTAQAIEAGALGVSTSRTSLHRTAEGNFVAGTFAKLEELKGLMQGLADAGAGLFEMAGEHVTLDDDIAWIEEMAVSTGRPVVFNLSQTDFAPDMWRTVLDRLEAAVERGAPVFAQCAGRAIGVLMNWRSTAHPFKLHPSWIALEERPWSEQLATLRDPEFRARLLAETPNQVGMFETYITQTFDKMYVLDDGQGYEPLPEDSLAARAKREGVTPQSLAYDALMTDDGAGFLYFPLFNYTHGNLDVLHTLHSHPLTRMGLSDGGAHCASICDGGMPTFMLTFWTRDRTRGKKLPLETIIHRQTAQTAAFYGLNDRGLLAPGYRADVNLIDYDALSLGRPELVFDLPAGGRRLIQKASGYVGTWVAGVRTMNHGTPTGALPGRLVRGCQTPSA
jgi:N-acyl-D-aspartate/D-glutamate deacylase